MPNPEIAAEDGTKEQIAQCPLHEKIHGTTGEKGETRPNRGGDGGVGQGVRITFKEGKVYHQISDYAFHRGTRHANEPVVYSFGHAVPPVRTSFAPSTSPLCISLPLSPHPSHSSYCSFIYILFKRLHGPASDGRCSSCHVRNPSPTSSAVSSTRSRSTDQRIMHPFFNLPARISYSLVFLRIGTHPSHNHRTITNLPLTRSLDAVPTIPIALKGASGVRPPTMRRRHVYRGGRATLRSMLI
ncbi:hypothetical protein B0H19DRAFT_1247632 [Mycena capillaripes]|nr:hypothetical protein B0H19DRAFT_1247632 [Mycena capillaripes]